MSQSRHLSSFAALLCVSALAPRVSAQPGIATVRPHRDVTSIVAGRATAIHRGDREATLQPQAVPQATAQPQGGGLTYDVSSRMYRGLALVGVEDTLHESDDAVALVRPLKMQLATMNGGRISPVQLAISHTSLDYDSVRIESPDSTFVRIRTGADPVGIVVPIPVLGLSVSLTPQQATLQGFGLATTDIGISLPRGMARTDTAVVTFRASGAPVRPGMIRVSGADGATVRVRSGQLGANRIDAVIDGVSVGHTEVVSELPLSFLVATLLGIAIGGSARFVAAKRRKRVRSLPWDIIKGAPFGLLASIASAVGLDLAQLKLSEPGALPAIVFTAAIGAWLGTRVLDRDAPARAAGAASVPAH